MAANVGLTFNGSNKQNCGDSFTAHLAGMSKNQLYDVMSQMKILIEQNPSQARQILVANPSLTKALFQAQIMLGMVKPPQVMPNIQQTLSQPPQQSSSQGQQPNSQSVPPSVHIGVQGQPSLSQPHIQQRPQSTMQSVIPSSSNLMPLQIQKPQGIMSGQGSQQAQSNTSVPTVSLHPAPQISVLQPQVPVGSSHLQQPLMNPGVVHQPPLPPQSRPAIHPFPHQLQPPMPSYGLQPSIAPSQISSQPVFQAGVNPPGSFLGSFPQGPPSLPTRPPLMKHHQIGAHISGDLGTRGSTSMQVDRVSGIPWTSAPPENSATGVQLPGSPAMTGQTGSIGQVPRPAQLSPEIEKALLQQVMSLTPEQINLLPPEQRQQVLQLQQMLR